MDELADIEARLHALVRSVETEPGFSLTTAREAVLALARAVLELIERERRRGR